MGTIACGIPAINAVRFVKIYESRKAVKVVPVGYSMFALLPNGTVATNNSISQRACFIINSSHAFNQTLPAVEALHKMKVISHDDYVAFLEKRERACIDENVRHDVPYFRRQARDLGISLTKEQNNLLRSKTHLKKLAVQRANQRLKPKRRKSR